MHPLYKKADMLSFDVISAAMEVHKNKGPGLLESIYERCLLHELKLRNHQAQTQGIVKITYKDLVFKENLRYDILVDAYLLIEGKCVDRILPIHKAQLMSYMKLLDIPIGLIVNYKSIVLKNDICRLILPGANIDD
ncbi:MAG: GxxExxY protein [Opitutaceae bacterium]|jgi:GxxExxY protein|nr:GxxExxY protein [Opitutaceae bacterium]